MEKIKAILWVVFSGLGLINIEECQLFFPSFASKINQPVGVFSGKVISAEGFQPVPKTELFGGLAGNQSIF